MHVLHVVGARPNFIKVAPVVEALARRADVRQTLVHTGQHYDANMSDVFFRQLAIPQPDVSLGVGGGSHADQTARIMLRFEAELLSRQPDRVLVYGDVNSTLAAALVCAKLGVPVGHVEAGLRSFDERMPEEINRVVTDRLSSWLFTPSADADDNLVREGVEPERIHRVGNVMIDTLVASLDRMRTPQLEGLAERFALVTLHRPSNVDDPQRLADLLCSLASISRRCQIVFPLHPRTRRRLEELDAVLFDGCDFLFLAPLGYLEFVALQRAAAVVITDSGGVQEETTFLGVPCITLRENTERPVTVTSGTNVLVGHDLYCLREVVDGILAGRHKPHRVPELWDGNAAERIAAIISDSAAVTSSVERRAA